MMLLIHSIVFLKKLSQTKHQNQIYRAQSVFSCSPNNLCQALECCKEKVASSWLSVIPVAQHGFSLHKTDFTDALCLRYGWSPPHLPSHCVCGKAFTISHALSCPHGAFPIIRHNDVRDLTAKLMSEVCHDVQVEPHLQPLSGELLDYKTAKHENDARVDIRAAGFWGCRHHRSFFDVRVFNPFAESNQSPCSAATFRRHEARNVSRKWNGAVLHHLCFPLQGVWAKLPQSLTNSLLPFLATNGTPHIRWLWDGCVAPWDFPYSAPL